MDERDQIIAGLERIVHNDEIIQRNMQKMIDLQANLILLLKGEKHMLKEERIGTCGGGGEFYFLFDEDGNPYGAVIRVNGEDVWDCRAKAADSMLAKWKQIHGGEWEWEPDEAVRFYGYLFGYMKAGAE